MVSAKGLAQLMAGADPNLVKLLPALVALHHPHRSGQGCFMSMTIRQAERLVQRVAIPCLKNFDL